MAQVTAGAPSSNFFLDGNFSPISEERDATDMEVIGEIPHDLDGHFLRVGPNPVYVFSDIRRRWHDSRDCFLKRHGALQK